MQNDSPPIFVVDQVSYAFPGLPPCLRDLSFQVHAGERLALIGANGSGKSTLLHLLDGLYFPSSGSITAFSTTLTEESVERPPFGPFFRQSVGFLFQQSDIQLFCPTVADELAFGPLQLRWAKSDILQRIEETLTLLEIGHLRDRTPYQLSGGEKKRVALASVLIMNPSVLLLDEPTAGLDPRSQSLLLDLLDALAQRGMTLITATHDLALLPHLADRALVLTESHTLLRDAPVAEVLDDAQLLMSVNLIHAHAHQHGPLRHSHPHQHIVMHEHARDEET